MQRRYSNVKFVIDSMLGTLARKLRIFGFDSLYYNHIEDNDLLSICREEGRVLLTSDKELFKRAMKENLRAIFTEGRDEDTLVKLLKLLDIRLELDMNRSRCPLCNSTLIINEKEDIKEIVPKNVYNNNKLFYLCVNCNKVYWEGSHIRKMQELIKRVNVKVANSR